ncbi:hypothetical protein MOSE0_G04830 [Monosporozyma servazzii]
MPRVSAPKIGKCQLLGPASLIIQSIMGLLIIMVLLLKRTYESPKRKLRIWLYDIIKQLGGSFVIHMLNIMLSVWKHDNIIVCREDESENDDECDWYFVNLLMDTTLGIPILYYILHGIEHIGMKYNISNIKSGDYFDDNEILNVNKHKQRIRSPKFQAFLKQFIIFIIALIIMKFIIYMILNYMVSLAYLIANLIIGWSDPWPNFQVFLIMFVCPLLLNCFQYYCVDNIIKLHDTNVNSLNWDSFEPTLEDQVEEQIEEENSSNYGSIDSTNR